MAWTNPGGNRPMRVGGKDPYPNIAFGSNVDWQDVNPSLLRAIQKAAGGKGLTANVNSGYRSNAYSAKVGGFAGDPHSKGLAVDAYVGGKPIGSVIPTSVWQALGVRSGNTFTYKGKPDPEHLDLMGASGVGSAPGGAVSPSQALAGQMMGGSLPQPTQDPLQGLIGMILASNRNLMQQPQPSFIPFGRPNV